MCMCREPLVLQESRYSCTSVFILAVLKLTVCALWPFFSCIHRVSASWQRPFCTFSSWHHSAGCSPRPGSPTWRWRERFGPGSSASAFCVWAGVSNIMFHCTSTLPFSLKVSGQGGQVTVCLFSSATLCGAARSSFYQSLYCDGVVLQSGSLRAG